MKKEFPDVSIEVNNHPVPGGGSLSDSMIMAQIGLIVVCFVLVPLTVPFLAASYVLFPGDFSYFSKTWYKWYNTSGSKNVPYFKISMKFHLN